MKKEKSCGGVVYRTEGDKVEVLLIKHRKGGHWAFPKGHVEPGETERQTARREILEETGLKVKIIGRFRARVSYTIAGQIFKTVIYFLAEALPGQTVKIQEEEILRAVWFDAEKIPSLLTYANDKATFARALGYLQKRLHKGS